MDLRFVEPREGRKRVKRDGGVLTATANNNPDVMEAALKELEKLQKLTSDEPSTSKGKTPAIQESLNSLLQTLHAQKKRLEAGLANEAELTTLARTVEARKKEIDERQKEIYNSLARYGKALDKVSPTRFHPHVSETLTAHRGSRRRCPLMSLSLHQKMRRVPWNMSSPRISSGPGAFLRQRLSFRYSGCPHDARDTMA